MNNNLSKPVALSIYVHWPFCLSKCPYCDFNSHVVDSIDHANWLRAYEQELDYFASVIKGKYIRSIFFGGGTPSLMQPSVVAGIIAKIAKLGIVDCQTEITLEANPTSFEIAKFKDFKVAGVNRVSIGVQALREEDLKKLGRQHDSIQAKKAIEAAAALFSRISFDLIYARSGQTLTAWQDELTEAMNFAKGHISLYQLTIEKGTPFYKLFHTGKLVLPSNELAADMYEWTLEYLASKGYDRYEISNYALEGQQCQHNLAYWHYDEYLGIGPGSHSRLRNFSNYQQCEEQQLTASAPKVPVTIPTVHSLVMHYQPEKWLKSVNELGQAIQSMRLLAKEEVLQEIFMMGLRLKEGINMARLKQLTGYDILEVINQPMVESYNNLGLLRLPASFVSSGNSNNLSLTDKGLMLHNYIVPRLLKN